MIKPTPSQLEELRKLPAIARRGALEEMQKLPQQQQDKPSPDKR